MTRRALLAPEVVQSSAMDCGPASLGCLLAGFGMPVSYGRLREACQTDVDGTSIDTLEDVARALGLEAEQTVVPVDHVLRSEAGLLPALAVVNQPNGLTHFVVVWRAQLGWVQLMDPACGRVWTRASKFLEQLYLHGMPVPAADWREWAGSDDFLDVLRSRMRELGCDAARCEALTERALADPSPRSLSTLDAAVRMTADLIASAAVVRGDEAARTIAALTERALSEADPLAAKQWIPERYWSAGALPPSDDPEAEPMVQLHGAVLLCIRGQRQPEEDDPPLPPDLAHARNEPAPKPARELLSLLLRDGWASVAMACVAVIAAAIGVLLEAAILRGLVELGVELGLTRERIVAWAALVGFAMLLLLLEGTLADHVLGIGRRLELRLRVAFLSKVPRLGPRYFHSRLSSDMAERIHAMHRLRELPKLGAQLLLAVASLILTVAGIAWLDPGGAWFAGIGAVILLATSGLALPSLFERDLRFRTHGGALGRVVLDALLGLVPIRTHGAGRALRREHEQLLVEWMRARADLLRTAVAVETLQTLVGFGVVVAIVARHSLAEGELGAMLLLIYWALRLPALGERIAQLIRQYPGHRSRALRLLEPLGAPDEERVAAGAEASEQPSTEPREAGVRIVMDQVSVRAAGHTLLDEVSLRIEPGEHVAIVGRSGAGKSSLVALLLGWHRAAAGEVTIDGQPLDGQRIAALRRQTAWIDPAIALWNEPLLDNLLYGSSSEALDRVGVTLAHAELLDLVANLPAGLQTPLGEGGGLLSGGEGQRVRLARALLRADVRLVILDEPLRGLDRSRRAALLERTRELWPRATLLCITHDIEETLDFPRVVVVDNGTIVQDGPPRTLADEQDGHYAAMLAREREVHQQLWGRADWRRLQIRVGRVHEQEGRR
ncbi:MAG TPA: ATP-binding cassette domain-containing protein [Enhygromyxa sp.]|nr:ATP-binding cassette domain-containing protein [Enhygromyxa sp.]